MTESTTSAGQLKFKVPASDEWCALPVDGQDKDQSVGRVERSETRHNCNYYDR